VAATRKRLWVTETPPVREALDDLRELMVREQQSDKARRLQRLADRIRTHEGFDVDLEAAEEVRRTGWTRPL
jgi:hypothetical protein